MCDRVCVCACIYFSHNFILCRCVSPCVCVSVYDLRVHLQEDEKDNLLLHLDGVGKAGVKVEEEDEEDKESAEGAEEKEVVEDEREEVYDEDDEDNLELLLGKRKG